MTISNIMKSIHAMQLHMSLFDTFILVYDSERDIIAVRYDIAQSLN